MGGYLITDKYMAFHNSDIKPNCMSIIRIDRISKKM